MFHAFEINFNIDLLYKQLNYISSEVKALF